MEKSKEEIDNLTQEQVWDEIAVWWNKYKLKPFGRGTVWKPFQKVYFGTKDSIVEDFISKDDKRVLDLGCGSGRNFFKFSWFKGIIYGVDFSSEMLKFAEQNAKQNNINVKLKKSNTWDLGFEDNFFDKIICIAVLHCIENKEKRDKTIKEMYRVLKPEGKIIITAWNKKAKRWRNKAKETKVSWNLQEVGKKVYRHYYLYDQEEVIKDLEKVGFNIVNKNREDARNIVLICEK